MQNSTIPQVQFTGYNPKERTVKRNGVFSSRTLFLARFTSSPSLES